MSDQLITVATFNFSTDPGFLLFKATLEHHQISYFAAEENTVNANPFLSISVGGIRIMVHEEDVPEAIGIWREIREAEADMELENQEDFGERDSILDDMRTRLVWKQRDATKSSSTYFILVAVLIGILLLFLFFAIWVDSY